MEIVGKPFIVPNIGNLERAVSIMGGTFLAYTGTKRKDLLGAGLALVGANLLRRGVTGYCYTYQYLGIRTAPVGQGRSVSIPYEMGVKVERSIAVNKPREAVFQAWRDFENLPKFMKHVKAVRATGDNTSHWVVSAPGGRTVEWDAEIINMIPNKLVHFTDATGGRGTQIRISLQYNPPGGIVGAFVAKLFGEEPSKQVAEDLARFKSMMESGQVPTNEGQTSGRAAEAEASKAQKRSDEESVRQASEESFPASDAPAYR